MGPDARKERHAALLLSLAPLREHSIGLLAAGPLGPVLEAEGTTVGDVLAALGPIMDAAEHANERNAARRLHEELSGLAAGTPLLAYGRADTAEGTA